jgi:hypothetical protein
MRRATGDEDGERLRSPSDSVVLQVSSPHIVPAPSTHNQRSVAADTFWSQALGVQKRVMVCRAFVRRTNAEAIPIAFYLQRRGRE